MLPAVRLASDGIFRVTSLKGHAVICGSWLSVVRARLMARVSANSFYLLPGNPMRRRKRNDRKFDSQ